MIAVLHVVPGQPHQRIERDPQRPFLSQLRLPRAFIGVHRAGFVLPQVQQHRHLVLTAQLVQLHVAAFLAVRHDVQQAVLPCAVLSGIVPRLAHKHAPLDDDVGLALHVPGIRVAELHLRVEQHFRADRSLAFLPGLRIRVPIGVQAAVAVHRRIAAEFADQSAHFVLLKNARVLVVQDVAERLQQLRRRPAAGRHGLGVQLQIVRRHVGHGKQHHALEKVEHRRRQAVALHALPLLSDEKILVGLHRVVQVDPLVELQALLIGPAHLLGGRLFMSQRFHLTSHSPHSAA